MIFLIKIGKVDLISENTIIVLNYPEQYSYDKLFDLIGFHPLFNSYLTLVLPSGVNL